MDRRILVWGLIGSFGLLAAEAPAAQAANPFRRLFPSRQAETEQQTRQVSSEQGDDDWRAQPNAEAGSNDAEGSHWELPWRRSASHSTRSGRATVRGSSTSPSRTIQRPTPRTAASLPAPQPYHPGSEPARTAALPARPAFEPDAEPATVADPAAVSEPVTVSEPATVAEPQYAESAPSQAGTTEWYSDFYAAHKASVETGRPMLIVFGAEWCHYCRQLESQTLAQPQMVDYVNANFIPVHLDMGRPQDKRLADILNVKPIPCSVVLSPQADLLGRVVGYYDAPRYMKELETARAVHSNIQQARFSRSAARR